jgi:phage/conjugal plasmid C-4 type zinc finger TraR family protein
MADDADIANDYIANEVSRALGKIRQQDGEKIGAKICKDCGEKIPEARRKLGFQLCVECAEETERRKSMFADY